VALAEAFGEAGWHSIFVGCFDRSAGQIIAAAGCELRDVVTTTNAAGDAKTIGALLRELGPELFLCDSYAVDRDYLDTFRPASARMILFDDFGDWAAYPCDAILNFTIGATGRAYSNCQRLRLLGPAYFPARKKMRQLRAQTVRRTTDRASRVLVAMGGNDEQGLSLQVLQALCEAGSTAEVHVITGSRNCDANDIEHLVKQFGGTSRYLHGLPDLGAEYTWADSCVAGGGLTKYEALFMRLPTAVISMNPGQHDDTLLFENRGALMNLGLSTIFDPFRLAEMLRRFLHDPSIRTSLTSKAAGLFPGDTTCNAVRALCSLVTQRRDVTT
jgi:spore coat polysaccharide biosynthesis predicted glycosyltransferase SpsG